MNLAAKTMWASTVLSLIATAPCSAQVLASDLALTTIAPCRLIDTRAHAQRFSAGQTRTFDIYGTDLSAQGGSPSGCGLPGFQAGVAQVQALAINFVAVSPGAGGNLRAWPSDGPVPATSTINFQLLTPNLNIANEVPTAVRQDAPGADISVLASQPVDLVADVVGYYAVASSPAPAALTSGTGGGGLMAGKIALASGTVCPSGALTAYGYPSGVTRASDACPGCSSADLSLLSPPSTCTARDLAAKMLGDPAGTARSLTLMVNGQATALACSTTAGTSFCNSGTELTEVPPASELTMRVDQADGATPLCAVEFGFRCN